ncbi:MBL fold metallo-hydrolase [Cupriavidus metallidurans]|uniref:MBL fold metallo-hydrolase n=1 Tax=Cupriavidus TaxID=106589 RepID=UPI0002A32232|nr:MULTISPECIES: MBL fold metallo-hydrolase [Cupriavidus]EKZ95370.1 metallo-beta-lactamase [Cupriavidus sp. HMR-1]GMG95108.1 zinc metallohydrolase glyoxalase II family protein [Cupriavidus sp. TKC]HBO78177.1 MBL fold metallo-hydrolase [Cupriavidus sp.]
MYRPDSHHHSRPAARLHYPCGEAPAPGQAFEIAPGVLWMRLPLPNALSHINVWAIEDGEGWAIVDTGVHTPQSVEAWQMLLEGPLGGRPVTRVLVTHQHPDHVGMAGWLTERFGCPLWMTRLEYLHSLATVAETGQEVPREGLDFYRRAGWDDGALDGYRQRFGRAGRMISRLPRSYRRLNDGETLRIGAHTWQVLTGQGHTPEHACLYSHELAVLIAGDQILPRISPNVSVHPMEPEANPFAGWQASLSRFRRLVPDDVLVLPAHNDPFEGLHARLDRFEQSLWRDRARLRNALGEPRRAIDLFGVLFAAPVAANDALQYALATGETVAYLNYLQVLGDIDVRIDDAGVAWYRAVAAIEVPPATSMPTEAALPT